MICVHMLWHCHFLAFYETNHHNDSFKLAEIIAIHETSREYVWLKYVIPHVRKDYGISTGQEVPIVIYGENAACIAQLKQKYIIPKFFFTHELQWKIWQIYLQWRSQLLTPRSYLTVLDCVVSKISNYSLIRESKCVPHSLSLNHCFFQWIFMVKF